MTITLIISVLQIIVSVLLIIFVLLQNSSGGLGEAFGGGDTGGVQTTRRGADKQLLNITVVLGITFCLLSLAALFIN